MFEFEGVDDNKKQIINQLENELNDKKESITKLIEKNNMLQAKLIRKESPYKNNLEQINQQLRIKLRLQDEEINNITNKYDNVTEELAMLKIDTDA